MKFHMHCLSHENVIFYHRPRQIFYPPERYRNVINMSRSALGGIINTTFIFRTPDSHPFVSHHNQNSLTRRASDLNKGWISAR